jgi:hypothetical protein
LVAAFDKAQGEDEGEPLPAAPVVQIPELRGYLTVDELPAALRDQPSLRWQEDYSDPDKGIGCAADVQLHTQDVPWRRMFETGSAGLGASFGFGVSTSATQAATDFEACRSAVTDEGAVPADGIGDEAFVVHRYDRPWLYLRSGDVVGIVLADTDDDATDLARGALEHYLAAR